MMEVLRIYITSWTTSFRYPSFISGFQPTLPVPPISTIYGILSAAKGELVTPDDVSIGYVFKYSGKAVDLEAIYELGTGLTAKSNIVRREILYNAELHLYLDNLGFEEYFRKPFYPILLGRSGDLASIQEIKKIELKEIRGAKLGQTILPLDVKGAFGLIQALPTHFTGTIPRKAIGVKPYILMTEFFEYDGKCLFDEEKGWAVWIHKS